MQRQAMIGQAKAWIKNFTFVIVGTACILIILLVNASNSNAVELDQTWSGDFDGMVERRFIRVLVTYNKTHYFLDRARERGATYEALMRFEKEINKQLKRKHLKINVVFIPVLRNELVSGLVDGRGDIAAAGLTITPERKKFVDFTDPVAEKIDEIVVAAPNAPKLASIEDLSGKEIYVRKSSSYHESLNRLNVSFEQASKPRVILKEISEYLEDEDLLEMVNAVLIPMIVVDNY
ncbi:MAG: transporter substrate-binding domain-containing protein, partial [Desulfobacterales bacterium]|nr:transporter substrate-binding domain-containing protein [Desulfobacterales bacterium]